MITSASPITSSTLALMRVEPSFFFYVAII
jgi:hypothetical protein